MKGLFRRGNIWWARFTPAPGAAQVQRTLDTQDEREAITRAMEMKRSASAEVREEMESCAVEIASFLAFKLRDGLSKSTLSSRSYVLHSFVKNIGARSPATITTRAVEKWFSDINARNPNTAADYLAVVKLWFKWMTERGKLPRDITSTIKLPAKLPMRMRRIYLMPAQQKLLFDSCANKSMKFICYCGLHAGLRKQEIIEARPEWFDLDAGLLHVQATATFTPKDRDNRTIPLTDEFSDWLKNEYGLPTPFMLEPTIKHGKYRYRYDFRKAFEGLARRCGFEHIVFHDLRRTFASTLVSRGVSIYKVAKWLGDMVEVVESTYGHLHPQDRDINLLVSR